MSRLLALLFLLIAASAHAVTINSQSITNYTGYIIAADAGDGNPATNRHRIATTAQIDFGGTAANYTVNWSLLDEASAVVATDSSTQTAVSGVQTVTGAIVPSSATPLTPGAKYRVKLEVVDSTNAVAATQTQAVGNTYIHFIGTLSGSAPLNVVSQITSVTVSRNWLLETDSSKQSIPVQIGYTLYRYDDWAGANTPQNVDVSLSGQWLRDSDGAMAPVTVSSNTFTQTAMDSYVAGVIKSPATVSGTVTIQLDPNVVLTPDNFHAAATISHVELSPSTPRTGNTMSSSSTPLYHFTGQVTFGSGHPVVTHIASFASAPAGFVGPPPSLFVPGSFAQLSITPTVGAGTVDGRTNYTFGGAAIQVSLASDGNAMALGTWSGSTTLTPSSAAAREGNLNGVDYKRTGTAKLDATGALSDIAAKLPTGVGWAADKVTGLLDNLITFTTVQLDQALDPTGALSITPAAGTFYLCEETKPIYIEPSVFVWQTSTGEFQCGAASAAHSIRKPLMDFINSYTYTDPTIALKRSNDHLYNSVTTAANVSFKKGASGGGEMTGDLTVTNFAILPHFPYGSLVWWNAATNVIKVVGDLINPTGSGLGNPTIVPVVYQQHCQDAVESGCGATKQTTLSLTPATAMLSMTSDGGVQTTGSLTSALEWGWNSLTSTYTHKTVTSFTGANFLMAGTFMRGDQNALSDEDGPANILLSGFDPANLSSPERPQTTAYTNGLGDYAGMNFRSTSFNSSPAQGASTLQGTAVGPYELTTRSKYYARYSGVSGIHESPTGPGGVVLGGYQFSLSSYGFSFLSNEMEDSRTSGQLDIITPCNFSLEFNELAFSCLGALESFELTAGATAVDGKKFDKWSALFTPYAVSFVSDNECLPGAGTTLVLGFSAHASHFETAFTGSLGIENTGTFATPHDHASDGVPTRLSLPGNLTLTGTTGETYTFFPTQGAYFNANPVTDTEGFWNVFGKLDVPFFEDMQVHLQMRCGSTTAGTADPETVSSIYFMGGWPTNGWKDSSGKTPFEVTNFDDTNEASPSTVSLADYRATSTEDWLPRAQKLWLGVVDFDYPLVWSNTTFSFAGKEAITENLLVLNTQHQLKYMDAQNAEITFGIQYEGLPTISVTNLAFNALDDATGVSSIIKDQADEVFRAVTGGVDDLTALLSDKAEDMIGEALNNLTHDVITDFTGEIRDEIQNLNGTSDGLTPAELTALLDSHFRSSTNTMVTQLNKLSATLGSANSFLTDLDTKLAKVQQAIQAINSGLSSDPDTGALLGDVAHGLLEKYDNGGSELERAIFKKIADALIDVMSTVARNSGIDEKIRTVLDELDPQLAAVSEALDQVDDLITDIRAQLGTTADFADELADIVTNAAAQLQAASNAAAAKAEALVNALTLEDTTKINDLIEDWNEQIAQELTDAIFSSQFVADIQEAVKERVYDLQSAFNSAVDTAFAAMNQMIRDALSEALAGVDESINSMLGDVAAYCGSGSLNGYAHINGDSLDELRIDGRFQMKAPDDLTLAAYLEIKELDSDGPEGCGGAGDTVTEVSIGALDVPLGWVGVSGDEVHADLGVKFALDGSTGFPIGLGGSFEMTSGTISFETFEITALGAACMFGADENYFAATIGMDFGSYAMAGGIFLGHACTNEPLEMVDPLVAEVLTMPSFTGIYCYGEATFPIYGTGTCLFNISGKAGAGVFYFNEGTTYGGRLTMGVYGEALCAVEIGGEVSLVGAKSGDSYAFAGTGSVYGKAGVCPICVEADFSVKFNYTDAGGWQVDY